MVVALTKPYRSQVLSSGGRVGVIVGGDSGITVVVDGVVGLRDITLNHGLPFLSVGGDNDLFQCEEVRGIHKKIPLTPHLVLLYRYTPEQSLGF